MITNPMEQAFVLLDDDGPAGACRTVTAGIQQAALKDEAAVDAWIAIGECVNRIAALTTVP